MAEGYVLTEQEDGSFKSEAPSGAGASNWEDHPSGYVGLLNSIPVNQGNPACHVAGDGMFNSLWVGLRSSKDGTIVGVSSVTNPTGPTVTVNSSAAHEVPNGSNAILFDENDTTQFWIFSNVTVVDSDTFTCPIGSVKNLVQNAIGSNPVPTTGTLKVFHVNLYDPNGAINIARTQDAQPLVFLRFWRKLVERCRMGLNAYDNFAIFLGISNSTAFAVNKNNGNVGIGVEDPADALDIRRNGNAIFKARLLNSGGGGSAGAYIEAQTNNTIARFGTQDGSSFFGTVSNHDSKFYANTIQGLQLTNTGQVLFPNISTTGNAANAHLTGTNQILRSTSARKYKKDIRPLTKEEADKILSLVPVVYKSAAAFDSPEQEHIGLIAEEVAEIEPRLVHWDYDDDQFDVIKVKLGEDNEGKPIYTNECKLKVGAVKTPQGVQYDRLACLLLMHLAK